MKTFCLSRSDKTFARRMLPAINNLKQSPYSRGVLSSDVMITIIKGKAYLSCCEVDDSEVKYTLR